MVYKRFILLMLCFRHFLINAQEAESFSKIYSKTAIETSAQDLDKALEIADSLYQSSVLPLYKLKSLMLSASLYQKAGNYEKTIDYAVKAKGIAETIEDYNWQTRINGFLASHYRELKLYSASQEYLKASISTARKIPIPEQSNASLGFIYQELAYSDLDMKKYESSIKNIRRSNSFFVLAGNIPNRDYLLANNDQLLGDNYFYLKKYPVAEKFYLKAEKVLKPTSGFLLGLVYNGLAKIKMNQDNLKDAEIYIKKSKQIAEISGHIALEEEIFKTNAEFYAKAKKPKEFKESLEKYQIANDTLAKKNAAFIDRQFKELNEKEQKTSRTSKDKSMVIFIFVIILMLLIFFGTIYYRNQKKQFERFKKILSQYKREETTVSEAGVFFKETNNPEVHISEETLQKILDNLKDFENLCGFTNKNMSLPFLAAEFKTNTKYLSYIIKHYRKKDFTNYINDLRIRYIINKMQTEANYKHYKISVMAEEAGFSSHSKFATIFKANTGLSPSLFIEYLKKEKKAI